MRCPFYVAPLLILLSYSPVKSQQATINLLIQNQLTGKAVDAILSWPGDETIKRVSQGNYQISLGPGGEGTLTVEKSGYFDSQFLLQYDSAKSHPQYQIKLQPGIPQLHITVLNDESSETLTSAIDLFTMHESSIVFSEEVEVSPYTIDLEYDKVHVLQVRSPGFFSFKDTIDFTHVWEGRVRTRTIRLVPLKTGNKIALNNIYFKQNEASLTDFARLMLVELTHILEQEKNIVIEIGAYTDDVSSDSYNLALSEKRALAVQKYLLDKGAQPKQLLTKGYGESAPVAANTSEENRALNRRVEFKIISTD